MSVIPTPFFNIVNFLPRPPKYFGPASALDFLLLWKLLLLFHFCTAAFSSWFLFLCGLSECILRPERGRFSLQFQWNAAVCCRHRQGWWRDCSPLACTISCYVMEKRCCFFLLHHQSVFIQHLQLPGCDANTTSVSLSQGLMDTFSDPVNLSPFSVTPLWWFCLSKPQLISQAFTAVNPASFDFFPKGVEFWKGKTCWGYFPLISADPEFLLSYLQCCSFLLHCFQQGGADSACRIQPSFLREVGKKIKNQKQNYQHFLSQDTNPVELPWHLCCQLKDSMLCEEQYRGFSKRELAA